MLMNVIYKIQMYSLHVEKDTVFTSVQWLSYVLLFVIPWTAAHQAPPSMGFSRQQYWSRVLLPSPKAQW